MGEKNGTEERKEEEKGEKGGEWEGGNIAKKKKRGREGTKEIGKNKMGKEGRRRSGQGLEKCFFNTIQTKTRLPHMITHLGTAAHRGLRQPDGHLG